MCGIVGLLILKENLDFDPKTAIKKMLKALAHRGPDDNGYYQKDNLFLGHARLSIIDVAGGHQPLYAPSGEAIIGNGEIYNYIELKEELKFKDFDTGSDFEPALHICLEQGLEKGIDQWRGMYATAIHLDQAKLLIVTRDHFGIKPLYLLKTEDFIAFASEPRAFIEAGLIASEIDPQSALSLLNLSYIPFEKTIYKNIQRIMPSETLSIDQQTGNISTKSSSLTKGKTQRSKQFSSLDHAVKEFDHIFEESILMHQRSDVPYGLFLSGGVDSTSILTMMARLNKKPVRSFSCGFDSENVHDETMQAKRSADFFKTAHHETIFTRDDFINYLPHIAWAFDDPTCDPAILPSYKLASMAKDHVKVVLSGEGGDEIFGGYGRYRKFLRPRLFGGKKITSKPHLQDFHVMHDWQNPLIPHQHQAEKSLKGFQLYDLNTWMPADLLLKLDRCLMAHGIEGRTPFLDKEIFAFASHLPDSMKIKGKMGKWLLRQWLSTHCPIADAFAKKKGFTVPVHDWLQHYLPDLMPLLKQNTGLLALMDKTQIEKAMYQKKSAWPIFFYAIWYKIHIEKSSPHKGLFKIL